MIRIIISTLCIAFAIQLQAQQYFADPVETFSKKKPMYITMMDGKEVTCNYKSQKIKKGLITEITVTMDGKKKTIMAEEIKEMYVPQSGLDKLVALSDFANDATRWESEDINMEHIKEGYAYFIQSPTQMRKKKEGNVLMQLLNPAFAQYVKVFHDPFAAESASASIGGIKVAGGIAKSYFVKVGDDKAFRVSKGDYKDNASKIYTDCGVTGSAKSYKWSNFGEELFTYTKECNGGNE